MAVTGPASLAVPVQAAVQGSQLFTLESRLPDSSSKLPPPLPSAPPSGLPGLPPSHQLLPPELPHVVRQVTGAPWP